MSLKWRLSRFTKEVGNVERSLDGFLGVRLNPQEAGEVEDLRDRLLRLVDEFNCWLVAPRSED